MQDRGRGRQPRRAGRPGRQDDRGGRQATLSASKHRRWSSWTRSRSGSAAMKARPPSESIGSLVAKIDGRDVPLTVGYHKVTVDIRDQIARTTIEESFVNHTNARVGGRLLLPPAARRLDRRLRHVDRRQAGRGRRGREAAGPRDLRDHPPRAPRSGPAGMVGRQHLQGPRLSHPRPCRRSGSRSPTRRCCRCAATRYRYQYALQSELLQAASAAAAWRST